jgi:phospholipid/cholesterol/gamma-HCH transport system substrate-binding protein
MTATPAARRLLAGMCCVMVTATGCAFQGLNSVALPGVVGRGPGAAVYHVQIANVSTLESNSPVMIDDVVVGSVGKMTFKDWHADVEVSVQPDVVVPANAVARIGQTSLLGSMHLSLDPPMDQPPTGRLEPGATIYLNQSSTYPSTEQTLSSLSAVVNGGGLGQIGDIIHNFNAAFSGRENDIRELLTRLNDFVTTIDAQRDKVVASIQALNRLSATFANQREVISRALHAIPPALEVLDRERPRITTALQKLGALSNTSTQLVNDTQADLVRNLQNLEPTIRALADVGPDLGRTLAYSTVFPMGQDFIDRGVRGDYVNVFLQFDITYPRLKRALLLGTRWGEEGAKLIPAPGDPWYLNYTFEPLSVGVAPPPDAAPPPPAGGPPPPPEGAPPPPPVSDPVVPVAPPLAGPGSTYSPPAGDAPVFAGPYDVTSASPPNVAPAPAGGR